MFKTIPILMYHSLDTGRFQDKMAISADLFEKHLKQLSSHFEVISLAECVRQKSQENILGKKAAITFDDGFVDNYTEAFPRLKRFGLPATFFISTEKIGQEGFMNWDMLKEIAATSGMEIGSHGHVHDPLEDIPEEKAEFSIAESKKVLEKGLGQKVSAFSYVSGSFNEKIMSMVERAGYEYACAASHVREKRFERNPYSLRRIKISATSNSSLAFVFRLSGFYNSFRKP